MRMGPRVTAHQKIMMRLPMALLLGASKMRLSEDSSVVRRVSAVQIKRMAPMGPTRS